MSCILFCDYRTQSNCGSYGGELEDISVDKSESGTSTSEAEITDSDSDS
jgi:hypothetical protein